MKTLSAGQLAAAADGNVIMVLYVELQFASGTVRLCTTPYTMSWNGFDWLGAGNLGSIEPIKETASLEVTGVKMTLSGMNSAVLSSAFNETVQGRTAIIYVAFFDQAYSVIGTPTQEFRGRIDVMQVEDNGPTGSVSLSVESRIADFKRPNVRRFNDPDQKAVYPNDRFFEFVPDMLQKSVIWPSKRFFEK